MCKSVRTKGKIYAKVANAESTNPFTQGCNWVCKLGIYHLCANFTLSLHVSKFEGNPFFRPVIQVHGNRQRNYNMRATATGRRGCGGEVICLKKVQQSFLNQSLDPPNQKFLDPPLLKSPLITEPHLTCSQAYHSDYSITEPIN